jgi:hypothetical protein
MTSHLDIAAGLSEEQVRRLLACNGLGEGWDLTVVVPGWRGALLRPVDGRRWALTPEGEKVAAVLSAQGIEAATADKTENTGEAAEND